MVFKKFMGIVRKNEFKGLNPFSTARRVAKGDKKIAKEVKKIIESVGALKANLAHGLQGFTEELKSSFNKIYDGLSLEAADIGILEKHALRQDYELMEKQKKIIEGLNKLSNIKDERIQRIFEIIKEKNRMIIGILRKSENEAHNIAREKNNLLGFNTLNDLTGLLNQIIKRERQVKKKIKSTNKETNNIMHEINDIENEDNENKRLKEEQLLLKEVKEFLDDELAETSYLYTISHDSAILLINLRKELLNLHEAPKRAMETGFDKEWCKDAFEKISTLHTNIKNHEIKTFQQTEDLVHLEEAINTN